MQCFVWCGLILAEQVIWLSLQILASLRQYRSKTIALAEWPFRRKVLQGLFPIPSISPLPVKSIWNPNEEALVIYFSIKVNIHIIIYKLGSMWIPCGCSTGWLTECKGQPNAVAPPTLSSAMAWRTEAKLCKSHSTITFSDRGRSGTAITGRCCETYLIQKDNGNPIRKSILWRIEDGSRVDEFLLKGTCWFGQV